MSSDEELIEEIKSGSHAAMEVLVNRHYKNIFAYVYRKIGDYHTAYDLTQEIFIKMIKSLGSYKTDGKFTNWLLTIAVNHCRDYFRNSHFQNSKHNQQLNYSMIDEKENIWDLFSKKAEHNRVKKALEKLPDYQREAIILKFYHDLKIREIAVITDSKEATVKSRLKQGTDKLKYILKGEYEDDKENKAKKT